MFYLYRDLNFLICAFLEKYMNNLNINDRVYIKRVELFFGHAVGNVISLLIAAAFTSIILLSSGVPYQSVLIWFSLLSIFCIFISLVEMAFNRSKLTIDNASRWIKLRIIPGAMVSLMYGLSVFLFNDSVLPQYEMFILIILISLLSLTYSSYTVMIKYCYLINMVTLIPFSLYLLTKPGEFNLMLAVTTVIIQVVFMAKARRVSKTVIKAIYLNEKLLEEIENHKLTKKHLKHMVNHDMLTGLPNRHYLVEKLEILVDGFKQSANSLAVLYIDLDGFKNINDTFGHDSGDVLLVEVANRIVSAIPQDVIVARLGGDEFVLIITCPDSAQLKALKVKQDLLTVLSEPYYLPSDNQGVIGASIGIAIFNNNDSNSAEALLKSADMAMYRAKNNNKKSKLILNKNIP